MTATLNGAQRQTICGSAKYVKRQRAEHEAPPLAVPVMSKDWPPYVPTQVVPVRPGADMHLQFRSRGV